MKKLLLVDGHSLVFRAFFAIPHLSSSDGTPTNALFGFLRMLFALLDQEQPDAVVVAFDAHAPTFRHESFEAYKANRAAMPDELRAQIPIIHRVLDDFGVPRMETPGFEADDIIGTLSKQAERSGWKTLIITGDNDSLQLVSDVTEVLVNNRGVTEVTRYTPETVCQKIGVSPGQVTDVKALMGDTSDNIPGVPGIGEKTASALIQEFGSLEDVLSHVESVKRPAQRKALEEHREDVLRNKRLVTIVRDMDIPIRWDDWRWQRPTPEQLRKVLEPLELRTLIRELGAEEKPGVPCGELRWRKVETAEELESLVREVRESHRCAVYFDIPTGERTGEEVLGLALAWSDSDSAYVPLTKPRDEGIGEGLFAEAVPQASVDTNLLWDALAGPGRSVVTHDCKRAAVAGGIRGRTALTFNRGISATFTADALVLAYLLNPSRQDHPIEVIHQELLGELLPEVHGVESRACQRAVGLWRLYPLLEKEIETRDLRSLYCEVEHPLLDILAAMELHGMLLDVEHLRRLAEFLAGDIATLEKSIHALAGKSFNIGSTKQLQQILFEKLNLPRGRKTKTGYSTDASVLEKLATDHQVVREILEYRELTKLKSTYVDGLLNIANSQTHRVHTLLKQTGSATGRLASAEPNLQNVPIRTEPGREIRRAFIAPPGTHRLIAADYSQIELRVLAHVSRDPRLMEAFHHNEDIHTRTAADIYHVDPGEVNAEMRRTAKVINFGIAYGMSPFGLATNLNIGPAEAQIIIDSYFATFPGVRGYMESIVESARSTGYVTTLLNRRRYLPDINSPNRQAREFAERTAINTPIQGSAADIIKSAMVVVHRRLLDQRMKTHMVLQVHDELIFEVANEEIERAASLIREVMETAVPLAVPVTVEVKVGDNWRDMQRVAEPA